MDYFSRQLGTCVDDDGAYGPAKTLPAVLGIIRAIEQSARDVRLDVLPEVLSVGARGAEFVG